MAYILCGEGKIRGATYSARRAATTAAREFPLLVELPPSALPPSLSSSSAAARKRGSSSCARRSRYRPFHSSRHAHHTGSHTHMGLDHKRCAHCSWLSGAMARCDERNAVWWMPLSIDHSACEPECMHTCCGASCEVMGVQGHVNSTANDCMCFHNEACAVVVVVTCCAVVVEVEVRRGRVAPAT